MLHLFIYETTAMHLSIIMAAMRHLHLIKTQAQQNSLDLFSRQTYMSETWTQTLFAVN